MRRAAMVAVYSGTAPIEAHDEAVVVAKVGGEVRQIYVEEGDTVKAGQVLARLDGDRLRLEVAADRKPTCASSSATHAHSGAQPEGSGREERRSRTPSSTSMRCAPPTSGARLELSYTEIRAPIAGVVSARHIKVGNTISPNDPTFRVTDLDPLVAYVHIPEKEFRKLAPGQTADVIVDALGGTRFAGTIALHLADGRSADRHLPRAGSKCPTARGA